MDSATIAGNTTTGTTGGSGLFLGAVEFGSVYSATNTIIAGNSGGSADCVIGIVALPLPASHSLIGTQVGCGITNGVNGNVVIGSADPLLGPLQDNGGDTWTRDLLTGSPAIDAGSTTLTEDQRGVARPFGLVADIGAVEHYACVGENWSVATEGDLDRAIACFNTKTVAGSHVITLTAYIDLTTSTPTINNPNAGVSLTIEGSGKGVDGNGIAGVRPFHIAATTTVTINDLTVMGGNVPGSSDNGGGILNEGLLTLNNSTIRDNTTGGNGGGIDNRGALTMTNSTLSGNTATGDGGGLHATTGGSNVLKNSTISGNSADNGGGIYTYDAVDLDSVTIAANSVTGDGSGLYAALMSAPEEVNFKNTILADNSGSADCYGDINAIIGDTGNNLIESQFACGFTDGTDGNIVGDDPQLGPLATNGGDTRTHALLPGSPALDAGSTTLTTDQRGVARPQLPTDPDPKDDIGAYESSCGTATGWPAGSEFELDEAIGCFNKQTVAGSYTITVTGNISVTSSSIARINNPTSGASLVIEGGDHTLNGGETDSFGGSEFGAVGFEITSATPVTINDLTLTRFRNLLSGAAVKNSGRAPLTLNNVSLIENIGGFGGGGAVTAVGPVTVTNSLIAGNGTTVGDGGGIIVKDGGSLTVLDSEFSDNSAERHGGAIAIETGALGVNITNSIFDGNSAFGNGGAIHQLGGTMTISASAVSNNTAAEHGGGIKALGILTLTDSAIDGNNASRGGGGLDNEGSLTVSGVTFRNNSAGKSGGNKGTGGGFQSNAGNTRIENSTFNGNRASGTSDDGGGAIMVYGGTVLLDSVTIAGNSSATKGGGIAVYSGVTTQDAPAPQLTMGNTIVSDNSASVSGPDLSGIVTSVDYNLVKDVSGATFTPQAHDITGQSAQLEPLNDNGGPTWTMALPGTSPAIDNGNTSLAVDQRGAVRPQGLADDIGAYEAAARLGTIIIRKSTAPVGAGGAGFNFNTSDFGNFTLKDGGKQTIHNVAAGVYTVTESALPTGYELSGISCVDSVTSGVSSTGDVASKTATINLEAGEIVTCRFVNAVNDSLTVEKITIPAGSASFSYTSNGSGNPPASFSVTAGQVQLFTGVLPQTYVLTEAVQKGYELTSLSCTSADGGTATGDPTTGSVSVTVAAGEQWHCTSVSTAGGDIYLPIITKNSTP
ncbi:MAG: hypothetical protein Kow0031_27200 [Anaerolineae bacterium]